MRFTAPRADLANMAAWAARAIKGVTSMPILGGILLEARGQSLVSMSAFNYDDMHKGRVGAHVTEDGTALVPGLKFAQLLGGMHGPSVEVWEEGTQLVVKSGASVVRFHEMALEQYPALPDFFSFVGAQLKAEELAESMEALAPLALRQSPDRPWMACVNIEAIEGRGIQLYCGQRNALGRIFLPADTEAFDCMVPARAFADAIKPFEGDLHIGTKPGRLQVTANDQFASLRTYDEGYPTASVVQIFAEEVSDTFKVPTVLIREAAKLVASAGDLMSMDFQDDKIVLTSANNDVLAERAKVADEVPCEASGTGWRQVDLKLLLPMLNGIADESLEISLMPRRNLMGVSGSGVEYVMATITPSARVIDA